MKTVAFSDILAEVCQVIGLDRTTLTDKSFMVIRDLFNRRINMIWDREAWPDNQRIISTWPCNPLSAFVQNPNYVTTEGDSILTDESDSELIGDGITGTYTLTLNPDFPRIYLEEFEEYRKGQIDTTFLKLGNAPWQVTIATGALQNMGDFDFPLNDYTTATDEAGNLYIDTVTITLDDGDPTTNEEGNPTTPQSTVTNGLSTPTAMFTGNPRYIIQAPDDAQEILDVWDADPRKTTRTKQGQFQIEEFNDLNALTFRSEYSYIRVPDFKKKFVKYRQTCPRLTGIKWSAGTYTVGSQVYYDTYQASGAYSPATRTNAVQGDFWTCVASTSDAPSASNASWKMVEIPHRFKDYLSNGVAADYMRSEGKFEEAGTYDGLAEMAVQQQIDVLVRQQGQVQKMNMVYSY